MHTHTHTCGGTLRVDMCTMASTQYFSNCSIIALYAAYVPL